MYFSACPVHEHSSVSSPATEPFRFLDLPPEIRNRIASLVLISSSTTRIRAPRFNRHPASSPEPMFLTSPRLDYPLSRTPPPTPPCEEALSDPAQLHSQACKEKLSRVHDGHTRMALLMACRRTYVDHWATYYRDNEFSFVPRTWESFRQKLPERCLDQIRFIHIRMPHRSRQMDVWRSLAELEKLERVTVVLATAERASMLERAACVAGAKICRLLRRVTITRDAPLQARLGEEDSGVRESEEKEDRLVENGVNEMLEQRWQIRREREKKFLRPRLRDDIHMVRKATSRAGSEARGEKRARRRIETSPMPDESSMDEYFRMVESATDEEETDAQAG